MEGEGTDSVDRDEENEIEVEKREDRSRGRERRGEVAVKEGQRLCKSERLEAHLNSGCVSPALAECYLL